MEYDYDLVRNALNRFVKGKTMWPKHERIMWPGLKLIRQAWEDLGR